MKKIIYLSIVIFIVYLLLFQNIAGAFTTVPTDYSNGATGIITSKIDENQTTNIQITAHTFRTPAGTGPVTWPTGNQILKLSQKIGRRNQAEYISANSATQSDSTVTLVGVNRYIDPFDGSDFTSQGNGLEFFAGALVEQIFPVQFAENAMMRTNEMRLINSGSILCALGSSRGCIAVGRYTTAQITGVTNGTGGMIMFDRDNSQLKFLDESLNPLTIATQTGSAANAGFGNRGEVELATPTEVAASTASGSSNAALVVPVKDVVIIGTATSSGRVVATNASGVLDATIGSTGTGTTNMGTGALIVTQAGGPYKSVYPGANGNFLRSNGSEWGSETINVGSLNLIYSRTSDSATAGASTTSEVSVDSFTLTGGTVSNGDLLKVFFYYETPGLEGDAATVRFEIGGTTIFSFTNTAQEESFAEADITVRDAGATGSIETTYKVFDDTSNSFRTIAAADTSSLDFTGNLTVDVTTQYAGSNAANGGRLSRFNATHIAR